MHICIDWFTFDFVYSLLRFPGAAGKDDSFADRKTPLFFQYTS